MSAFSWPEISIIDSQRSYSSYYNLISVKLYENVWETARIMQIKIFWLYISILPGSYQKLFVFLISNQAKNYKYLTNLLFHSKVILSMFFSEIFTVFLCKLATNSHMYFLRIDHVVCQVRFKKQRFFFSLIRLKLPLTFVIPLLIWSRNILETIGLVCQIFKFMCFPGFPHNLNKLHSIFMKSLYCIFWSFILHLTKY